MAKKKVSRYLSPFRYPGGKSWFTHTLGQWLSSQTPRPEILIEPFGGGAGISLFAISTKLVAEASFAELDPEVAATWRTILNGHGEWLARKVKNFKLTRTTASKELARRTTKDWERAFQCILKNRTARGGVMAPGAGAIRDGDGNGIASRWYAETLAARIRAVARLKKHLTFAQEDAFELIRRHADDETAAFFVDPPYTKAAKRLYQHWKIDHPKLFEELAGVSGPVLMTYDDTSEVRGWAQRHGFQVRPISMKTTHHTTKCELMISRDFGWFDVQTEKPHSDEQQSSKRCAKGPERVS